jgi:hypothetical protein
MKLMKQEVLPLVHEILRRRYGVLDLLSGQGIAKGERVKFMMDGKKVRCVIKTSTGGRISFGRPNGKWSGLDDSDAVVIVAPRTSNEDVHYVSMFDQSTLKEVFDLNQAAQMKAGMGDLPNWIAPFHEEGRGPRGTGDGFGPRAKWTEPLNAASEPRRAPGRGRKGPVDSLTIAEAKAGLAKTFGVSPDAVEITIRG